MRTTSVQRTARKTPFDSCMRLVHFNLQETDNCNLSVPDNGHSARPRMIVAVQKKTPLRADSLKATPPRKREGVAPRVYRGYYGVVSNNVISNSNSSGQVLMATKMLKQQSVDWYRARLRVNLPDRDTSLQRTKGLLPMCPLFGGSTVYYCLAYAACPFTNWA